MSSFTPRAFLAKYESLLLYAAKCCVGGALVHGLASISGYISEFSSLISLILVLTPDSKEAVPLAIIRMKANLCGLAAAMASLAAGPMSLLTLCLALILCIIFCHLFKAMVGSRSAMAAAIIILWHPPGQHLWDTAVERLVAVFLGCAIGLAVTLLFHRRLHGVPAIPSSQSEER